MEAYRCILAPIAHALWRRGWTLVWVLSCSVSAYSPSTINIPTINPIQLGIHHIITANPTIPNGPGI